MHKQTKLNLVTLACGLALGGLVVTARPARGDQIVAVVDEHGHKIYINLGEPELSDSTRRATSFRPRRYSSQSLPPPEIHRLVEHAANRHSVDPELIHAIIQVESDYNSQAVSRKGAMGLMQLVPATARRFGVENPFDPKQNIEGGVNYLKYLLNLFQGDLSLSLAAYNAGENSVLRFGGIPSYAETQDYVRKVTGLYNNGTPTSGSKSKRQAEENHPIFRYVDAQGVVHFTNGDEF